MGAINVIWHGAMYGLGTFTFCNGVGWFLWRLARCAWRSYRKYCREADAVEAANAAGTKRDAEAEQKANPDF